ncbi:MAG: hypothetical protein WC683_01310 [bacterium]
MTMRMEHCNVVDIDCLAPANSSALVRSRCFRCGMPVCLNCSQVQPYLHYGRKRICNDCRDEMARDAPPQPHRCGTVVYQRGAEVGTCVDCGKRWRRVEVTARGNRRKA